MIELYGSPTPSACTIAIMLEEAGYEYTVFPIHKNNDQIELDFLKTTPKNIFPVLLDREGPAKQPVVIFETTAILIYLAEKSGKLLPTEALDRLQVLQWLFFESSKIAPTLSHTKHFMYHAPEEVPYAVKRFNTETKRVFSLIEQQLGENEFIAGDYSIADVATFPWLREFTRYGLNAEQVPNISQWVDRLNSRESIVKGLEVLSNLKE